jgi:hypothetical protein
MFINFLYVLVYALKNHVLVLNFFFSFYFSFVIDNWYFSLLILKCANECVSRHEKPWNSMNTYKELYLLPLHKQLMSGNFNLAIYLWPCTICRITSMVQSIIAA